MGFWFTLKGTNNSVKFILNYINQRAKEKQALNDQLKRIDSQLQNDKINKKAPSYQTTSIGSSCMRACKKRTHNILVKYVWPVAGDAINAFLLIFFSLFLAVNGPHNNLQPSFMSLLNICRMSKTIQRKQVLGFQI
jgi:predicted PurR-regulated permease PerM